MVLEWYLNGPRWYNGQWYLNGISMVFEWYFEWYFWFLCAVQWC